jgi:hypothetical protein
MMKKTVSSFYGASVFLSGALTIERRLTLKIQAQIGCRQGDGTWYQASPLCIARKKQGKRDTQRFLLSTPLADISVIHQRSNEMDGYVFPNTGRAEESTDMWRGMSLYRFSLSTVKSSGSTVTMLTERDGSRTLKAFPTKGPRNPTKKTNLAAQTNTYARNKHARILY